MSDLDKLLSENTAPAARSDLSARILAAASTAKPANDVRPQRSWWKMGGIAAMALMAAFLVLPSSSSSDDEWIQVADASGFSELYSWVEGEDG